ncbi:MAG: hypothetical protein K0R66_531 [Gammaproteobacteria bacterium]|jgi:hypothetical protein|nr:hypothetical protein [Gammaproteobacteria bacterium]
MFNCTNLFNTTTKKIAAASVALGTVALAISAYGYSKEEGSSMGPGAFTIGSILIVTGLALSCTAENPAKLANANASSESLLSMAAQV